MNTRHIKPKDKAYRAKIETFLHEQGLLFDEGVEFSVAICDEEENVVATGSFEGNVIKCIAIDPNLRGINLAGKVVTNLINEQYRRGINHAFVYTKPSNIAIFKDFGFNVIGQVQDVALLDNKTRGVEAYINSLQLPTYEEGAKVSAIVMNANPFTLGHRHLVQTAAQQSDIVHVFMVQADKSAFSTEDRYRLISEGVTEFGNVYLHYGGDYIISGATFPSYFLKDTEQVVDAHAQLDIQIFCERIAPALGITTRYVGTEPTCKVTSHYNNTMHQICSQHGINVVEVERLVIDGTAVSASKVRELLSDKKLDEIRALVPSSTYEFLLNL